MNERIEGTILIDHSADGKPHVRHGATFAGCTIPSVKDVQVDYAGEVVYAVAGEPGNRTWWFAGIGTVPERR